MARERNAAATAIMAAAALAPTAPPPPDAEFAEHGDGTATTSADTSEVEWVGRIAELNTEVAELQQRVDALSLRRDDLEHQLAVARADAADARQGQQDALQAIVGLRKQFDVAWRQREAEIASLSPERVIPSPEAPAPPAPPRRPRAVGSIRCHLRGEPITLSDGQDIPEGVDLSTLPKHAFEEG